MATYLQNVYEFQKLLRWNGPGDAEELARASLPEVEGQYFPGHYAPVGGVFHGVRPSPAGPIFFAGGAEIPLVAGRHRVTVERQGNDVVARLHDGADVAFEVAYTADPVLEFDMYEGRPQGLFDWLAEQLARPTFFERLSH